jgi:hypothetical protein
VGGILKKFRSMEGYCKDGIGLRSCPVAGFGIKLNAFPSGFGGLEVACWPLVPKFAGSHPAEAGRINPQHAFLRRGNKAVGPMS